MQVYQAPDVPRKSIEDVPQLRDDVEFGDEDDAEPLRLFFTPVDKFQLAYASFVLGKAVRWCGAVPRAEDQPLRSSSSLR